MLRSAIAAAVLCTLTTAHAQREPVPLNNHQRLGQRFTVAGPIRAVWVSVPSWSDNEGGLTLSLWDSPQRAKLLARQTYTGVRDNEMVELPLRKSVPAGSYFWEADARTGQTRIGLYVDPLAAETNDCAYLDGVPDRKRSFVYGTGTSSMPRPGVPRLIATLTSGASLQEKVEACRQLAVVGTAQAVPALARLLGDPQLSHMARYAMESMPGPAVDAALRAALATAKGRLLVGVVNSIGVRRDAAAVGGLARLLKSPDVDVYAASAIALGRIGTPASAAALEKANATAAPGLRPALQEGRLVCAERLAERGMRDRAVRLYDLLRAAQTSEAIRSAAMHGAIVSRGPAGVALLTEQLRAGDQRTMRVALWTAQHELPGAAVTAALSAEAPRLTAERRLLLIQALSARGDRGALPAIEAAAAAANEKPVRVVAISALANLGRAAAVPVLVRTLSDPDSEISQGALDALGSIPSDEVTAAVAKLLDGGDAGARLAAISLIVRQRPRGSSAMLLKAGRDPDAQVRLAALKALGDVVGANDLPILLDALTDARETGELDAAEQAVSTAARKASDTEACARVLVDRLASARTPQKSALLRVLGGLGGPTALAAVRDALAGSDADARATALSVLCEWKTTDAAPDLLKLARSAAGDSDGVRALRGALRMAGDRDIPVGQRFSLCKDAGALVQRDDEKRMLLAALGGVPSVEALALVVPHLDNAGTKEEASAAVVAIAEKLAGGPEARQSADALERASKATTNPDLAKRAKDLLEKMRATEQG